MKRPISAVIITRDEERNIERCLASLGWADEILVVDSGSTDRTVEICRRRGSKVITAEWLGFGRTKRLAVASAAHDWVLSVDADEEVTPELGKEIVATLSHERVKDGYKVVRLAMYLGKWIHHCGWGGRYTLRLFDRTKGTFTEDIIHEQVKIDGEVGKLTHVLKHYTYPDLETVARKTEVFAEAGAQALHARGKRSSLAGAYLHAVWTFVRVYIVKAGFLDGRIGLVLATNYAHEVYLKYLKAWEKNRRGAPQ
jgi:glycosyltransferase involved in cell wall biosynthesis